MKNIQFMVLFLFVVVSFTACKNNTTPELKTVESATVAETATVDATAKYAKVEFGIDGMTCAMGCAKTIEKQMAKMDGVKSAVVDFEKELAMVEYDENKVTPQSLEEAVSKVSDIYKVRDVKLISSDEAKASCKEDCKKACCADADGAKEDKMACAKDCNKACCATKA